MDNSIEPPNRQYIPLCLLGDHRIPTTYCQNQNKPMTSNPLRWPKQPVSVFAAQAAWRPSNAAVRLRLNTAVWRCMPLLVTWGQMALGLVKKRVIISYTKMRSILNLFALILCLCKYNTA